MRWGAATFGGATIDSPLEPVDGGAGAAPTRVHLALHDGPPAAARRDTPEGPRAVGELLALAGRRPVGHGSLALVADAAGLRLAYASAPCDVADPSLSFHALPAEVVATISAGTPSGEPFDARTLFFDRACTDTLSEAAATCRGLATVRWTCRFGPLRDAAWCSPCESRVFPEGADPATCGRWRAWCDAGLASPLECAGEEAVCLAGEPARAAPCDLACACHKDYQHCLAGGGSESTCAAFVAKCQQY
ncbi:MAG: hypothetical protein U1F43_04570 [Myxococcota bacterium]